MRASTLVLLVAALASPSVGFRATAPMAGAWQRTQCGGPSGTADLPTQWGKTVRADTVPLPEYPRPMMVRLSGDHRYTDPEAAAQHGPTLRDTGVAANWGTLNGLWGFQPAPEGPASPPFGKTLNGTILVPFPVESCLSGVAPAKSADIIKQMYYQTRLTVDKPAAGRVLVHFGAVDWQTTVWLNAKPVCNHTGGFDGFTCDITDAMAAQDSLLVYVYDPSDSGKQPNGKQRISAIDSPGGDTYTPSSGIWQTVWVETVPAVFIAGLRLAADDKALTVTATVAGTPPPPSASVQYTVLFNNQTVAKASGAPNAAVKIAIPSPQLWSPSEPNLYSLHAQIGEGDAVLSYFGMRTFTAQPFQSPPTPPSGPQPGVDRPGQDMPGMPLKGFATPEACEQKCAATAGCVAWAYGNSKCPLSGDCWLKASMPGTSHNPCRTSGTAGTSGNVTRPVLNGKFTFLAGWLDQSWWPDGQYTAPTDAALASDVVAVKTFGLNMIRLHQKVNSERWYYHADVTGVVVFQDAPQKYGRADNDTVAFYIHDMTAMIEGRGNHPCIVQWETFNEGDCWEVFNKEPYTVQDMVALARKTDWQNRLVDTDSGGGANKLPVGDVNDIHSYPWPGTPVASDTKYAMVGEFGGIGVFITGKEWVPTKCHTYLHVNTSADEASTYVQMAQRILNASGQTSASVYTQITDVELECDGFLNYDRTSKFTAEETASIRAANQELIAKAGLV